MSTTQRTSRPTQGGFVSIEMIIVLIIIAIGVGLGLAAAAGMFSSSNANEEQRNISVIAANARALKTSSGYGSSGTNLIPSLIAINGVPKNMSVSSGVVYNVYGGSVTVSSTGMGFSITTSKLPKDACITLSHQDREEHLRADQDQQRIRDHRRSDHRSRDPGLQQRQQQHHLDL
ncbi:type 4 pilus major pilin [Pseudomonas aeruginosa]|uniref:type 4 pilus major pilin n=1 Tax=Pseudomonas aeruginosa TaxID=287 RepID=UPI003AB082F4